jgi:hypothetical protein
MPIWRERQNAINASLAILDFSQLLPGACFPEVSTDDPALIGNSFLLPRS